MFCADCGFALVPGAPVGVAQAVASMPSSAIKVSFAPARTMTPGPQILSLLLSQQIILGGPALAAWEKLLLMLAYWLQLESLALGVHTLSLVLALSASLAIGSFIVFLLLFPLFFVVIWRWKRTVITRRGQTRLLKRAALLLLSLLATSGTLAWLVRESLTGQQALALSGPNSSILICAWLAVCATVLVKALLA
jgi:hypothetical protein